MNQYFQDGRYIDYTPEADVAAGTFVRIGNITGFANLDIKAGVKGALCTEGVVKVEKATGTAISAGAKVYWGGESKAVTTAGATYIGVCNRRSRVCRHVRSREAEHRRFRRRRFRVRLMND